MKETGHIAASIMAVLFVLFLFLVINRGCNKISNAYINTSKEYVSHLGKRVAIDGDTLTITSYTFFEKSFGLSNGAIIHYDVAKKFMLEE